MSLEHKSEVQVMPCNCGCDTCVLENTSGECCAPRLMHKYEQPRTPVQTGLVWFLRCVCYYGLPPCSGLAMFVVAGPAVSMFGFQSTMVGVMLGAILTMIRGYLLQAPQASGGRWMMLLHHTSSLAALTAVFPALLTNPLKSKLDSWLATHNIVFNPCLLPPLVVAVLTLLFVLGLEKSRVLRRLLLFLLFITTTGMFMVGTLYYAHRRIYRKKEPVDFGEPMSLYNVFGATAFVVVVFTGTTSGSVIGEEKRFAKLTQTQPEPPILEQNFLRIGLVPLVIVFQMFSASLFFVMGAVKMERFHNETAYVFSVFQNGEVTFGWDGFPGLFRFVMRDVYSLVALVAVCISLVEVKYVCVQYLECVNNFLPPTTLWTNSWTGTRVRSICIVGSITAVLASVYDVKDLIILSGMSYFIAYAYELITGILPRFKPCYDVDSVVVGDAAYQLVDDEIRLIESEDSDEESCDSGHSTDTDIDGIVHEYKQAEKVKAPGVDNQCLQEALEVIEITPRTHRRSKICLILMIVNAIFIGVSPQIPIYGRTYGVLPAIGLALLLIVVVGAASFQPQQFWIDNWTNFLRPPVFLKLWPPFYLAVFLFFKCLIVFPSDDDTSLIMWGIIGVLAIQVLFYQLTQQMERPTLTVYKEEDLHSPAWCHFILLCFSIVHTVSLASLDYLVCLVVWILAGMVLWLRMQGKKWMFAIDNKLRSRFPRAPRPALNLSVSYQKLAQAEEVGSIVIR